MANETFELKSEHITLLTSAYVDWDDCETGAPAINPKRPYGNSNVELDVAEMLGWDVDEEEGLTEEQYEQASKIHHETQKALQIILSTKSFQPGIYQNLAKYGENWELLVAFADKA